MTTTLHIISVSVFFKRLKSHRNLFLKVQLIINENLFRQWLGTEQTLDFNALPESVVIQVNGAYKFLLDWLLITSSYWEMYIDAEKNGTVWAHEGYLHPHSWMSGWFGSREGLTIFYRIPNTTRDMSIFCWYWNPFTWKFCFPLAWIQPKWSSQDFAHDITAVLLWHVHKFVAIWWPVIELQQCEVFVESGCSQNGLSGTGPEL